MTEDEYQLLKLGPRFIYDDPITASKRRTTELSTLKRKLEKCFHGKKVSPGRPVELFIAELDAILRNLHNITSYDKNPKLPKINNSSHNISYDNFFNTCKLDQSKIIPIVIRTKKTKNYNRLIKRLAYKFRMTNTIIRRTDKSKVFHLGSKQDYEIKSKEYMDKTKAYVCLNNNDPLPNLILRINKYLLDLRLAHHINQKQYEQLVVKPDEVELSHLYYLPKAHKMNTPLRPIIAGLKHPTIKISKFIDNLLRPCFNQMAKESTVTSGFELMKQLNEWSKLHMKKDTLICTMDVSDLYTMIPQTEGVLSLRKMMEYLNLKQLGGLKTETIIKLCRLVVQNNFFSYNNLYYHQIRGGAMGSPLTLTLANCYMFFFEREIVKQVKNSGGIYLRYIDDIFIVVNWPDRHLLKQIEKWNKIDLNIKLNAQNGFSNNFLDLFMENINGHLFTKVYHKPSHEPYYLPFNSIHPMHIKQNIPFTMMLRAIRYCSTFNAFINERELLRIALLLNKYPGHFIDVQFNKVWTNFNINQTINTYNYDRIREIIIQYPDKKGKIPVDYNKHIFIHFTYCLNMKQFPKRFHTLWSKYFGESPIADIIPVLGVRNVNNLQQRLVHTKKQ